MFVISENEARAMDFSSDFKKYAMEQGIQDPFEISRKIMSKHTQMYPDGTILVDIEWDKETGKIKEYPRISTKVERDAYIVMRDKYIARRCFEEIGYESFYNRTHPQRIYDISDMRT